MLSFQNRGMRLCDRLTRRETLRVGGLSACGLSLPQLMGQSTVTAAEGATIATGGRAKSCIVLFLMGGPPQHSTWDPKPEAPDKRSSRTPAKDAPPENEAAQKGKASPSAPAPRRPPVAGPPRRRKRPQSGGSTKK